MGVLINDINRLLSLVQEKLDNERALLSQVENLEKRFRMIYERASVGIFLLDQRGRLVMSNASFQEIIGEQRYNEIHNQDVNCLLKLFNKSASILELIGQTFELGQSSSLDLPLSDTDESLSWVHCLITPIRDDAGDVSKQSAFIQGIITDVSERKREEEKIRFHAERDPLTNLLNRRSAQHSLKLLLEKSKYDDSCIAICQLDLDNFKPINDTYGHDAGDKVLIEIAQRLNRSLRSSDLVARLGGDEFLLVIQGAHQPQTTIVPLLDKLLRYITEDIEISEGITVQIGASIGVSLSPEHGQDLDQLMIYADQAMYQVKQRGKKGCQLYVPTIS